MTGKYTVNEVEERTRVPAATLRQWERRYGFPLPERSASGYRLYGDDDLRHIVAMKRHIDDGVPASRAAEMVQDQEAGARGPRPLSKLRDELVAALVELDEGQADRVVGEAHALHPLEDVVLDLFRNTMIDLGRKWHDGEINTTTEHFASSYVQGRLRQLMSLSGTHRHGPRVIVACAPHDQHELGAMMLAVMLRREGYLVFYVGANTPVADLAAMARDLQPAAVMVSASSLDSVQFLLDQRARLDGIAPVVAFGGHGFDEDPRRAELVGGVYLGSDIPAALEQLAERLHASAAVGVRA
ncbi:MAG: cobalamin-dependent protein [Trueperaceae bacterium]|nr:cobalamin-dependent protein [Trueperaceae bacterium]